ncbi:MAG: hypothetical protein AB8H03_05530 [Saprospiraceae bacterium]
MKFSKFNFLIVGLFVSLATFTSCGDDDDDVTTPITLGSSVTVTNTFQSTAFTMGAEQAIEDLFQVPAGSLASTANTGAAVEFPAYLLNLYDIDIDENSISFEVVAQSDDPTYGDLFRILEADTYDRYYLTFDTAQDVSGFTSSNSFVNLRIDSDKVLVVEIGEGYDFKSGQSFSITLN